MMRRGSPTTSSRTAENSSAQRCFREVRRSLTIRQLELSPALLAHRSRPPRLQWIAAIFVADRPGRSPPPPAARPTARMRPAPHRTRPAGSAGSPHDRPELRQAGECAGPGAREQRLFRPACSSALSRPSETRWMMPTGGDVNLSVPFGARRLPRPKLRSRTGRLALPSSCDVLPPVGDRNRVEASR
jgi:hypothetical protein